MPDVNVLAVLVAAVASFVVGGVYYAVLGDQLTEGRESDPTEPGPWWLAAELVRGLVTAAVVAGLAASAGIDGWTGGLLLGLALWVGFPVVLLAGSAIHEGTPWKLAGIHAGDWLAKLLVVAVIVSIWQ